MDVLHWGIVLTRCNHRGYGGGYRAKNKTQQTIFFGNFSGFCVVSISDFLEGVLNFEE